MQLSLSLTAIREYIRRTYYPKLQRGSRIPILMRRINDVINSPPNASPASAAKKMLQEAERTPIPLLLRALLRNIITLQGNERPSVDSVLQFLCTSNVLLNPNSASTGAAEVWGELRAELGPGEVYGQGPYFIDLPFEEGGVYFLWYGDRLFFLTREELTGLGLEIRGKVLYRVSEKNPEPIEGEDVGDVREIPSGPRK